MLESPHEALLNRTEHERAAQEHFPAELALLVDVASYGSNLANLGALFYDCRIADKDPFMHRRLILALLFLANNALSQPLNDVSCLSPEQRNLLAAHANEMSEKSHLKERIASFREVSTERSALAADAIACSSKSPLEALASLGDGCSGKIKTYNVLVQRENGLSDQIQTTQELIIRQLLLERSALPACRN